MKSVFLSISDEVEKRLPFIVIIPSILIVAIFMYGFTLWSLGLSFTSSTILPADDWIASWVGLAQYKTLFSDPRWWVACKNIIIFGALLIFISISLGLLIAIFLDQKIRAEGFLRTIYLYPMSLSFIVSGVAWKWLLNPGLGVEKLVIDMGFADFRFDWLINPEMAIYTVVLAGVWQVTGFVMVLFLAGLRRIDQSIISAAKLDGVGLFKIYTQLIIPNLLPVFFSVLLILFHIVIKSFDLVMALTNGGPGYATDLPAVYMYTHTFSRNHVALGSASAIVLLAGVLAVVIPYLYTQRNIGDRAL